MNKNNINIPGWMPVALTVLICIVILGALAISNRKEQLANLDLPITVTEYFDYQCIHCARFHPVTEQVAAQYGDKVVFEFKAFPFLSELSYQIAYGAEAAREQNMFLAYHNTAFAQVGKVFDGELDNTQVSAEAIAALVPGLDLAKFATDMANPDIQARVTVSKQEAAKLGVTSTPTVFIAGQQVEIGRSDASVPGGVDYTPFQDLIARLVSEAEARAQ